jgi:hypothetical protein
MGAVSTAIFTCDELPLACFPRYDFHAAGLLIATIMPLFN